ncbi:MAG: transporter substrate-binding domain-containing protein [Desulfobacterales bacterium]|nr:transporter substrate-binding domain-containing protein [Desulfobacterales bacterium]
MKRTTAILIIVLLLLPLQAIAGRSLTFSTIREARFKTPIMEIITEAYNRLGIAVTFAELNSQRALISAEQGEYDGELFRIDGIQNQFPHLVQVDIPCFWTYPYIYVRRGDQFPVDGWQGIPKQFTMAALFGIKHQEQRVAAHGIRVVWVRSPEQALRFVSSGKADFTISDKTQGALIIDTRGISNLIRLSPPLERVDFFHYLHRKNEHLVPRIRQVLADMTAEGRIAGFAPSPD